MIIESRVILYLILKLHLHRFNGSSCYNKLNKLTFTVSIYS